MFRQLFSSALCPALCAGLLLAGCATDAYGVVANGVNGAKLATAQSIPAEAASGAIRAVPMPSAPLDKTTSLQRIIFASCAQQNEDQSMWDALVAADPDLTLYMGDNVYGDVRSNDPALPELKAAYMRLAQSAPFARLRAVAPMLTVWDDHDYGLNDAGTHYPYKDSSQKLFNYVWDVPDDSPRRQRPGLYDSWMIGEAGRTVQIIMLDTRYFRDDLMPTDERGAPGKERYIPDTDRTKTMLGPEQWAWLAQELEKPADLRLLVSSIQVHADGHGWEAWRTLTRERDRLYAMLANAGADNTIILSGDRHAAALYERTDVAPFPLVEATSSSINLPAARWRAQSGETRMEAGPHRLGDMIYEANFGTLDIDWPARTVDIAIRGEDGDVISSKQVQF
ncbi:MAG: alkaline phosphatase D family protein [Pseudomonadota bacterium]